MVLHLYCVALVEHARGLLHFDARKDFTRGTVTTARYWELLSEGQSWFMSGLKMWHTCLGRRVLRTQLHVPQDRHQRPCQNQGLAETVSPGRDCTMEVCTRASFRLTHP